MGTLGKQTTDITLDILDWNDVSVSGDILGAELAVSQSRILLDWYNFGGSFSTTVDLSSTNNIDFLGYVYGYNPGTPTAADKSLSLPEWLPNNSSNISGLPDGTSKTANISLTYKIHNEITGVSRKNIYLWFKAGNIYKSIEVVYDNSYIPCEVLRSCSVAWNTNTPAGIVFAKKGNYLPNHEFNTDDLYSQLLDEQRYIFASDVSTDVSTSNQYGTGFANTAAYITALGANATGPNKCKSLGAEWYVPSLKEMETLKQLQGYLGTSYMMVPGTYWTSTAGVNTIDGSKANILLNYSFTDTNPTTTVIRNRQVDYLRCIMNHELLSIESTNLVADYWNWGQSLTKRVPFTSKNGAVSIQSIGNIGTSKDWLVSATVNGSTSGTIDITYQPTAGNNAVHDDVAIIVTTTGGEQKTITVKYDNGYITHDMLVVQGWTNAPVNGIHVNKKGLAHPTGTAGAADLLMKWANVSTSVPAAQQMGFDWGPPNTTAMVTTLDVDATAANACRALGSDWYLPSKDELSGALYPYRNYMGSSYEFTSYGYWSSTELSSYTSQAWYVQFGLEGTSTYGGKTNNSSVRCMRNF